MVKSIARTGTYAGRRRATATKTIQKAVRAKKARMFTKNVVKAVGTLAEKKKKSVLLTGNTLGTTVYSPIWCGGLTAGWTLQAGNGFLIDNIWNRILIGQGTNNQQRVGNEVCPTSLQLKGFITATDYDRSTNKSLHPFEVHMILYKNKLDSNGSPASIVEDVNNTMGNITGTAPNSLLTFNRKGYIIHKHRVFRFKPSPYQDPTASFVMTDSNVGTGTVPINMTYGSSSNQMFKRFSVNVPMPKTLKFNDGSNQPTNTWCSVGFYVVNGDGTALVNTQNRANVYLVGNLRFTDL